MSWQVYALLLVLSGCATGLSWLAYFRALQIGPASRVAPVDKLSLAVTLILAALAMAASGVIAWRFIFPLPALFSAALVVCLIVAFALAR